MLLLLLLKDVGSARLRESDSDLHPISSKTLAPQHQPIDRNMRRRSEIASRSVASLCMLFKIKSNPVQPVSGALPLQYVPAPVTRGALVAHIGTRLRLLAVGLLSTAEPLCPSRRLFLTILVIPCLMVWD